MICKTERCYLGERLDDDFFRGLKGLLPPVCFILPLTVVRSLRVLRFLGFVSPVWSRLSVFFYAFYGLAAQLFENRIIIKAKIAIQRIIFFLFG